VRRNDDKAGGAANMTPKQNAFVAEYLKDLNATQAAIRAGYSEATAYSQGQRLLNHVEVSAVLGKAKAKRAEECGIDAAWVLREAKRTYEAAHAMDKLSEAVAALKLVGAHVDIQAFRERIDYTGTLTLANALDKLDGGD
jgi:phage terminase small subunit